MSVAELEVKAYRLAQIIEWNHAKDRAALQVAPMRGRPRISRQQRIAMEYDPHAAHELGELIIRTFVR